MRQYSVEWVRAARLASLLLGADATRSRGAQSQDATESIVEVVTWLAAMQAQDLASVKWSLGVRIPGLTEGLVDEALASRKVLRTWPMRGTIHLIPATDAQWMLNTMGVRALSGVQKRWEYLGLDRPTVERAAVVLSDALADGRLLTRSECAQVLVDAGIDVTGQRLYHLLWHTSQIGVTCIGPNVGKEQTFALLADYAGPQRRLEGDEALTELAWRFVRGHGPVLESDLAGWSGMPITSMRRALAANDGRLTRCTTVVGDMWCRPESLEQEAPVGGCLALPGFDEFVLGYKAREAIMSPDQFQAVVPGKNGMFRPTVVSDGRVIGTWQRKVTSRSVKVSVSPFRPLSVRQVTELESSFADYGRYLGRVPAVDFNA